MFARILLVGAVLIASLAYFFAGSDSSSIQEHPPYIQGRNKTVLILANQEAGLSNVLVATASALLENYPDIEVHYASFGSVGRKLERVSAFARKQTPAAKDIIYHGLKGYSFSGTLEKAGWTFERSINPRGAAGMGALAENMQHWISPWTAEEHWDLYQEIGALIEEIDPAVVAVDTIFRPALDATRDKNRLHAFISPNTLVDNFIGEQPASTILWKYPAFGSGLKYPVPLWDIPENIYLNIRFIYAVMKTPVLSAKKAVLKAKGLKDPINFLKMHRPDVPWITMNTEGASVPVDVIPANVTCAGPIVLAAAPAAEQDPELTAWLAKAPTILINFGSHYSLPEASAKAMALALDEVFQKTNVQVLWKMMKRVEYSDDFKHPVQKYIDSDRLRITQWLTVDPYAILETGNIAAFMHHGGSNCYHEGVLAGVAHIITPMWADLFNFAALAENENFGVWACKDNYVDWTPECLSSAFLEAVDGGARSQLIQTGAKKLGEKTRAGEKGRDIAAREIAKLAYKK